MRLCLVLILFGACGVDTAAPDGSPSNPPPVADHPAYVEHLAAIFQRSCTSCHGGPTGASEPRNCVRADRWDSAPDASRLCSDPATAGKIFGVRDAGPMIVDNVTSRRMPLAGPPLSDDELQLFQRWAAAGYPKRVVNQPPTIELTTPPPGGATVCETSCSYAITYATQDLDGDSVTWSLGWSGGGTSGVFAAGLAGGSGSVMIDATPLGAGTYTLTATLDDGTAKVASTAAGSLHVVGTHNAAPTVTVSSPNGGEGYDANTQVAITWVGSDPDDATLTYDVAAVGPTTTAIGTLTAPVGPARLMWTTPQVTTPTSFRIQVTARDATTRSPPVSDRSDADFVVRPPPTAVSFAQQIQPIFNASCTGCHAGSQPSARLSLASGASYGALVNVASGQCGSDKRVLPGQPDQSYLIFKLQGSGACFSGSRMPKGRGALSATQMQLIRDWITNGALNN